MPNTEPESPVHVAVGVISNSDNEVLIARRHPQSHQGGLWEFPGGKVEPGETLLQALNREFSEELNLRILEAFPLIQCVHDYGDKCVLLDVWEVTRYEGQAQGMEGQQITWQKHGQLSSLQFPAANAAIIQTLGLPRELAITPQLDTVESFAAYLEQLLAQDLRAIQIRQKQLQPAEYAQWFRVAQTVCQGTDTLLMSNGPLDQVDALGARGVHLDSSRLMAANSRPVGREILLSAACHNLDELRQAQAIGVDFALLSPVCSTGKYENRELLGWNRFARMSSQISLPVFALGGLQRDQWEQARHSGAFGIAGIGMYDQGP